MEICFDNKTYKPIGHIKYMQTSLRELHIHIVTYPDLAHL